jgi:O-antigen ligase
MAFFGVFARGPVNAAFGLLAFWALLQLALGSWWLSQPSPPLPRLWLESLAAFLAVYLAASLAGAEPLRSLRYTGNLAVQLSTLPLAWLALSQHPPLRRLLPVLYGLGLMACAFFALKEAGWGLVCLRAKAHLGVIELGAVLGQLAPVMVGALALALRKGQKWRAAFFLASLAACFVALRISCSRIGLIAAPLLSAAIFLVNWRAFGWKLKLAALLLAALAAWSTLGDPAVVGRFVEMGVPEGNLNNDLRKAHWVQGLAVFRGHPVLGSGPGAVPSPPPEALPKNPDGSPAIPWKPYSPSHQVFINVLAESGLLGLIGFLALHLAPLVLIRPNLASRDPEIFFWSWSAAAVAAQFLLNGLTDQIFGLRPLMYIYWTTMAFALWLPAYKRERDAARAAAPPSGRVLAPWPAPRPGPVGGSPGPDGGQGPAGGQAPLRRP